MPLDTLALTGEQLYYYICHTFREEETRSLERFIRNLGEASAHIEWEQEEARLKEAKRRMDRLSSQKMFSFAPHLGPQTSVDADLLLK